MSDINKPKIQLCLSPVSFPIYRQKEQLVIVTDVFRATTTICAAIHAGVKAVIPVANRSKWIEYKTQGYILAGEREGLILPGADFGNSPLAFLNQNLMGETLVLSTTNGTKALAVADESNTVVVGAFSNLAVMAKKLVHFNNKNVVIVCSGWKNMFSLEDTLFAGALISEVTSQVPDRYSINCDAALASIDLWEKAKHDLMAYIQKASHYQRLMKLGLKDDISFCLQLNTTEVFPVLTNNYIINQNLDHNI